MDGVLADFEGGFLKKFRAKFPNDPYISLEDRRGFWVSTQYGQLRSDLCEKAISIWESQNFFMELDPLPGAVEAVQQMSRFKKRGKRQHRLQEEEELEPRREETEPFPSSEEMLDLVSDPEMERGGPPTGC
ncbi:NT5M protein, partial [Polyodon spathula]|nr:NT5M protein [Polyodon spathula]